MRDDRLDHARHHAAANDWPMVAQVASQVLRDDPQCSEGWHLRGVAKFRLDDHAAAITDLREAHRLAGEDAEILDHLGAAAASLGEWQLARDSFEGALRLDPTSANSFYHLGKVFRSEGKPGDAARCFRRAVELRPTFCEANINLGNTLREMGNLAAAESAYRQALALRPNHARAWNQLSSLHLRQQRWRDAKSAAEQAIALRADYAEAYYNLGNACRELAEFDRAAQNYRRALEIKPDLSVLPGKLAVARPADVTAPTTTIDVGGVSDDQPLDLRVGQAQLDLANRLRDHGLVGEAVPHYHEALRHAPDQAVVWNNLGSALLQLKKLDEAESCFFKARELCPNLPATENNLAAVWMASGRIAEACDAFRRVVEQVPDYAEGHSNYGGALQDLGDFSAAAVELDRAIELAPDSADARWNRSLLYLRNREWQQGWDDFEWRWKRLDFCRNQFRVPPGTVLERPGFEAHVVAARTSRAPLWRGEPLVGKRLLVFAEQGLGDVIQFLRFLGPLKSRGATVIMECPGALTRLLAGHRRIDVVVKQGEPLPDHDYQLPIMSAPHVMGVSREADMSMKPNDIRVDRERESYWQRRLRRFRGLRVGVHWQGNPNYKFDCFRSIPLAAFAPLNDVTGVTFVSLQHGFGCEQIDACQPRVKVQQLGPNVDRDAGPFIDTAAILKSLDLVVTSDSALPHLAGTLGIPTWLALPYVADWRWGVDGDTVPWYPSMRLFRQRQAGDWDEVFRCIASAIRNTFNGG